MKTEQNTNPDESADDDSVESVIIEANLSNDESSTLHNAVSTEGTTNTPKKQEPEQEKQKRDPKPGATYNIHLTDDNKMGKTPVKTQPQMKIITELKSKKDNTSLEPELTTPVNTNPYHSPQTRIPDNTKLPDDDGDEFDTENEEKIRRYP